MPASHLLNRRFILLCIALFCAGCQQTKSLQHTAAPSTENQVQQLSSLIAASEYLRNKCDRADIPAPDQLMDAALRLAKRKGWDTRKSEYKQLPANSQRIYMALLNDSTPVSQQCQQFNLSMCLFIDEAMNK